MQGKTWNERSNANRISTDNVEQRDQHTHYMNVEYLDDPEFFIKSAFEQFERTVHYHSVLHAQTPTRTYQQC